MNASRSSGSGGWTRDGQETLVACSVMLIALIFSCGLLLWLPQLYNNWQLERFSSSLFSYPLPPQTEVISGHSEIGLMGNGNHCDFLATQTMRTQLSKSEIEAYYDEVFLPPVNTNNAGRAPEFRDEPRPVFVDFDGSLREDGWQHFTIELFDFGYAPGLDWRCR